MVFSIRLTFHSGGNLRSPELEWFFQGPTEWQSWNLVPDLLTLSLIHFQPFMLLIISWFSGSTKTTILNMHVTDHTQEWLTANPSPSFEIIANMYCPAPWKDVIALALREENAQWDSVHMAAFTDTVEIPTGIRNFLPFHTSFKRK